MLVNLIHPLFWLSQDFVGKAKRAPVGMGIDLSSGCKNLLEPVGFSLAHTPPPQAGLSSVCVCFVSCVLSDLPYDAVRSEDHIIQLLG